MNRRFDIKLDAFKATVIIANFSTGLQLHDIIWDDFDQGEDHIVPHLTNARSRRNSFEGDSCKKPRRETTPVLTNTNNPDVSNTICHGNAERDSKLSVKEKNMIEKDSWSHAPLGVVNESCDGEQVNDTPNLASDDTRIINSCFESSHGTSDGKFSMDNHVLSSTSAAGENPYSYPLTHIPEAGDICFVDNDSGGKASGDLMYYSWPDIGNLDDVDKMLRSCDSSFGLGVTNNDDELGWFTSAQVEGTEEALKMDFKFPCPEPSGLKNILPDIDSPESNNQRSSCISESKDEYHIENQINMHKKQLKHLNQTEGKKVVEGMGNDGSFYQISGLTSNDSPLSSNNRSDLVLTAVGNQQQYRNLESDYFGHMQSNVSYLPPDYPYQIKSAPMLSGVKSEHQGLKSASPKGSSYASNQGYSMESSGDPSFIGSPRKTGTMFQSSKGALVSADKQAHPSAGELESQSVVEGVQKRADICSLNAPESSSRCPELDEISLEATSFRQLRQVMEQ
ncbi:LNK1-like protein isoform X1, partial [Tanacetum coccineum]